MAEKLTEKVVVLPSVQDTESPQVIERAEQEWIQSLELAGVKIAVLGHRSAGKTFFISRAFGAEDVSFVTARQVVRSVKMGKGESQQVPAPTDVRDRRIHELEQECQELKLENERLQSRVAEERRATARETRQYDQLLVEVNKLQQHNENLLNYSKGRQRAVDATAELLLQKQNAQLRMLERYEGIVEHVHGDNVTVVFEVEDDIVEHKYGRNQFIDGQLPNEGDRLTVYVHVIHGTVETEDSLAIEVDESDECDDERSRITGPIEF